MPLSWTMDNIGPMCRTVEDTAIMLKAIAGADPRDPDHFIGPRPGLPLAANRRRERPEDRRSAQLFVIDTPAPSSRKLKPL